MNPLILEEIKENLKKPGFWGKFSAVIMFILVLVQLYCDVQDALDGLYRTGEDLEKAEEELDKTQEKGKESEKSVGGTITEMNELLQFMYEESVLMRDRMEDLEFENKRLEKRLDRYRELSGFPLEEMTDEEAKGLAEKLLPFLYADDPEGEGVPAAIVVETDTGTGGHGTNNGGGTGGASANPVGVVNIGTPDVTDEPRIDPEVMHKKRAKFVDPEGQLKVPAIKPAWDDFDSGKGYPTF